MQGPFAQEHVDAWGTDLVDVESLNAGVSSAILKAITEVRLAAQEGRTDFRSESLLVLGPAGAGKTHLFARLRRQLGPKATFLLVRPEVGSDLTPRHILGQAVDALRRKPPQHPDTQLDLLVGSALGLLRGGNARFPSTNIEELRGLTPDQRDDVIASVAVKLSERFPEIDETWMAKFLLVPAVDAPTRSASLAWLSGREPDELQLKRLGLKDPLPAATVLPALNTLSVVAAHSAPLVVMFDQLENLVQGDETNHRITAYAQLVSELYDSVRGLVILQMALDAEWQQRVMPVLSGAQKDRLNRSRHLLTLPNPKQRLELIDGWNKALPEHERQPAPWPLGPDEWRRWGTGPGVTPRALMVACRSAYDGPAGEAPVSADATDADEHESLDARLEALWKEQLGRARAAVSHAHAQPRSVEVAPLLGGCVGALSLVGALHTVPKPVQKAADLRAGEAPKAVDLYLAQSDNGNSTAALLHRALEAAAKARVVVAREQARPLGAAWKKGVGLAHQLKQHSRVLWLDLAPAEVEQVLALGGLLSAARSRDLTGKDGNPLPEERVRAWAGRALKVKTWRLIAALLGEAVPAVEPLGGASAGPLRHREGGAEAGMPPAAPSRHREGGAEAAMSPAAPSVVRTVLTRLRLMSVERMVREARKADGASDRAAVTAELLRLGEQVRWYGRSIVAWHGEEP